MLPEIILHNSVSLNGSLVGFNADLDLHYGIARNFKAEAYLAGSATALQADEEILPEEASDFNKRSIPEDDIRPYWIVADSKGKLQGRLHQYRRMEYIRDIIVLVSQQTPKSYLHYLHQRNYDVITTGNEYVNYEEAFKLLRADFAIKKILLDTGSTLSSILLSLDLVDRISLIISPFLLSDTHPRIFSNVKLPHACKLELMEVDELEKDHVWLDYRIIRNGQRT